MERYRASVRSQQLAAAENGVVEMWGDDEHKPGLDRQQRLEAVTGSGNRRAFERIIGERINERLKRCSRPACHDGRPGTVVGFAQGRTVTYGGTPSVPTIN